MVCGAVTDGEPPRVWSGFSFRRDGVVSESLEMYVVHMSQGSPLSRELSETLALRNAEGPVMRVPRPGSGPSLWSCSSASSFGSRALGAPAGTAKCWLSRRLTGIPASGSKWMSHLGFLSRSVRQNALSWSDPAPLTRSRGSAGTSGRLFRNRMLHMNGVSRCRRCSGLASRSTFARSLSARSSSVLEDDPWCLWGLWALGLETVSRPLVTLCIECRDGPRFAST
mmetsp:Transcript_37527/g.89187  ORF Transcript_37527/g.89187 Transcript_37527/m.89187 type:complete len:225 (-) Transcript_37527:217-891(-)